VGAAMESSLRFQAFQVIQAIEEAGTLVQKRSIGSCIRANTKRLPENCTYECGLGIRAPIRCRQGGEMKLTGPRNWLPPEHYPSVK
jgi:hypothetical protein